MGNDLKYALRMLRRSPGFTLVAVLSLALGIGANSAIFTVTNAILLTTVPVADPPRLVQVQTADKENPNNLTAISLPNFRDLRDQNHVFSGMLATMNATVTLSGRGDAQPLAVQLVTADYFDLLGIRAARGRTFFADEDQKLGGNTVAVLSHAMWVDRFGGDPSIVGQTIDLNNTAFTVIGIAPPEFKGLEMVGNPDLIWIPLSMHAQAVSGTIEANFENRRLRVFSIFGRLQPGVSIDSADAEMKVLAGRLEQEYPFANDGHTLAVSPLASAVLNNTGGRNKLTAAAWALSGVAILVLLIACLNLANLLMARASRREREMSIRAALGAERQRLSRQLLTENLLLAVAGGVAGLGIAAIGRHVLWSFRPPYLPADAIDLRFDPKVLVFTAAATILTGLVFGLVPALRGSRPDLNGVLKGGGRGSTGSAGAALRRFLVVAQIALTVIALAGAGLFIHSMESAQSIDPGFESQKLFSFGIDLAPQHWSDERGIAFQQAVLDRVRAIPGVERAALASAAPFTTGLGRTILKQGQQSEPHPRGIGMAINHVSPGYFDTLRIRLLRGRVIDEHDRADTMRVVVINEAVANLFWPGEDPIGKQLYYLSDPVIRTVIGEVANTVVLNFGEVPRTVLYIPLTQNYQPFATIDVRTKGDPAPILAAAMAEVKQMNSTLAPLSPRTVRQQIDQGLWAPRMGAALFGVFGGLGLLLAGIGIYGVMSYMVAQRTSEIGIRMALGARPREVQSMVIGEVLRLAAAGIVAGLGGAFLLARFARGLFYRVSPADPVTFAGVTLLLIVVAAIAGWIPGRRASRIDPILALRESA